MKQHSIEILSKMISFNTITPKDNGILDYLAGILSNIGFTCSVLEFGEGNAKVKNLYAKYGTKGRNFCFLGHVDVVPTGDLQNWNSDPFTAVIKDDVLYGRYGH